MIINRLTSLSKKNRIVLIFVVVVLVLVVASCSGIFGGKEPIPTEELVAPTPTPLSVNLQPMLVVSFQSAPVPQLIFTKNGQLCKLVDQTQSCLGQGYYWPDNEFAELNGRVVHWRTGKPMYPPLNTRTRNAFLGSNGDLWFVLDEENSDTLTSVDNGVTSISYPAIAFGDSLDQKVAFTFQDETFSAWHIGIWYTDNGEIRQVPLVGDEQAFPVFIDQLTLLFAAKTDGVWDLYTWKNTPANPNDPLQITQGADAYYPDYSNGYVVYTTCDEGVPVEFTCSLPTTVIMRWSNQQIVTTIEGAEMAKWYNEFMIVGERVSAIIMPTPEPTAATLPTEVPTQTPTETPTEVPTVQPTRQQSTNVVSAGTTGQRTVTWGDPGGANFYAILSDVGHTERAIRVPYGTVLTILGETTAFITWEESVDVYHVKRQDNEQEGYIRVQLVSRP